MYTVEDFAAALLPAMAPVLLFVGAAVGGFIGVVFVLVGIKKAISWAAMMIRTGGIDARGMTYDDFSAAYIEKHGSAFDDPVDRTGWSEGDHFLWDRFQEYRQNYDNDTAWAMANDDLDYIGTEEWKWHEDFKSVLNEGWSEESAANYADMQRAEREKSQ